MSGGEAATHQNFYIFVEFRGFSEKVSEEFHNFCCRLIWSHFFLQHFLFKTRKKSKKMKFRHREKISECQAGDSLTVTVARRLKAATLRECQNFRTAFGIELSLFHGCPSHLCVHELLLKAKHWQALNKMENKYKKQKKKSEKRGNGKGMKEMEGKDKSIHIILLDVGEGYKMEQNNIL